MPPTLNKALPTPTLTLPNALFSTFFISLIYIENKCLYDAIRDLKRDNFFLAKGRIEHGSIASKDVLVRDLPSEPLKLISYIDSAVLFLVSPIHLD